MLRLLFSSILLIGVSGRILFAQNVSTSQIILPSSSSVIPFSWQEVSIGGTWVRHAAMLVPIRLNSCPHVFYMQFDTGSPYSILYTNKLESIKLRYPSAIPDNVINGKLKSFLCSAGGTPFSAGDITVAQFDSSAINWTDTTELEIIGTFGTDLIDTKVAIIDYPKNRLLISDTIPAATAKNCH